MIIDTITIGFPFSVNKNKVKMSNREIEPIAMVRWENDFPNDFQFKDDMKGIVNEFCSEMDEIFMMFGKYAAFQGHYVQLVLNNGIVCLSVKRNNVILDIPTDLLDIKVLIDIMDRKYGEIEE